MTVAIMSLNQKPSQHWLQQKSIYFVLGACCQLILQVLWNTVHPNLALSLRALVANSWPQYHGVRNAIELRIRSTTASYDFDHGLLSVLGGNDTFAFDTPSWRELPCMHPWQTTWQYIAFSRGLVEANLPSTTWKSVCCVVLGLYMLFQLLRSSLHYVRFDRFIHQNATSAPRIMPHTSKLSRYFELSKLDANLLDDYLFKKYSINGLTHALATAYTKRIKAISTIEPANFKAVLATSFDDWQRPPFRAGAARPFLKTGILTLVSAAAHIACLPLHCILFWAKVAFGLTMLF
jgi:hypothetical protein